MLAGAVSKMLVTKTKIFHLYTSKCGVSELQ